MTEPSHASSLATAIDRVEERMALTELKREPEPAGTVDPAEASLEVTVSAETSASPEQILAAARDFSAHRAQVWPNVEAKRLDVHERGDTWAEVTEGTTEILLEAACFDPAEIKDVVDQSEKML